jgi:carbon monoxide dehydrogenase subunit G
MPRASYTHSAVIAAPAIDVWRRLQDPETWRTIGGIDEIWDPTTDDGNLVGFRWKATAGTRRIRGTARVTERANPQRMVLALSTSEMTGTLTADLDAGDGATGLDVTLTFASRGMVASLFFPLISNVLGEGLTRQVDEFAASF